MDPVCTLRALEGPFRVLRFLRDQTSERARGLRPARLSRDVLMSAVLREPDFGRQGVAVFDDILIFAAGSDHPNCPLEGYRVDPGKILSHFPSLKSGDHVPPHVDR